MIRFSRRSAAFVVLSFIFMDLFLCSLFFVENDRRIDDDGGHRLFVWSSFRTFDFRTSQLDHCALALIRFSLLLGALIGVCYDKRSSPSSSTDRLARCSLLIDCFGLFMATYSPIKLLALSEETDDFRLPWFWSLFGWNMFASAAFAVIWTTVLGKVAAESTTTIVEIQADGGNNEEEVVVEDDEDLARLIDNEEIVVENGTVGGNSENRRRQQRPKKKTEETEKRNGEKEKKEEEEEEIRMKEATSRVWRLLKYSKNEWPWYALGFVFLVFYSGARIFIPYYTGRVISDIVVQHSYSRLLNSVMLMGGLSLGSALFAGLRGACFSYAIAKLGTRIRADFFLSLVKQEIGFFDVTKTGDITSRLSADCQSVSDSIASNFNIFLRSSMILIGTLVFMFKLSWRLTVMTFVALPIIIVITKVYGRYYERLSKETQESLARANEIAEEVVSSMRTVRSFANEMGESKRYNGKLTDVLNVGIRKSYAHFGYVSLNELFDLLLLIAVLWYGGHLVLTNKMKSEDLLSYLLYQLQLGDSLMAIGWVFTGLMNAVGAAGKVFEWIDRPPAIPNDGSEMLDNVSGRIEFRDVSFSYPSRPEVDVLSGVNFQAEPGEVVALVGPSGGGKSSCIALLEHFYEPTQGAVLLDGIPVQQLDHTFFHRAISLVGQEPVLFARSISENIGYGLTSGEYSDEDVVRSAKLANAHDFINAMPSSYETDVGEKGVQLSGGQKQRVAIARALIRKPKVLLLDEATSALDAESEYLVKQAIHQNLAGHTVLLIAHRLSTVEKADKIVVINKGRVVQQGNHSQLLAVDGLYRNLVHRQLLGDGNPEDITPNHSAIVDHHPVVSKTQPIQIRGGNMLGLSPSIITASSI